MAPRHRAVSSVGFRSRSDHRIEHRVELEPGPILGCRERAGDRQLGRCGFGSERRARGRKVESDERNPGTGRDETEGLDAVEMGCSLPRHSLEGADIVPIASVLVGHDGLRALDAGADRFESVCKESLCDESSPSIGRDAGRLGRGR